MLGSAAKIAYYLTVSGYGPGPASPVLAATDPGAPWPATRAVATPAPNPLQLRVATTARVIEERQGEEGEAALVNVGRRSVRATVGSADRWTARQVVLTNGTAQPASTRESF